MAIVDSKPQRSVVASRLAQSGVVIGEAAVVGLGVFGLLHGHYVRGYNEQLEKLKRLCNESLT